MLRVLPRNALWPLPFPPFSHVFLFFSCAFLVNFGCLFLSSFFVHFAYFLPFSCLDCCVCFLCLLRLLLAIVSLLRVSLAPFLRACNCDGSKGTIWIFVVRTRLASCTHCAFSYFCFSASCTHCVYCFLFLLFCVFLWRPFSRVQLRRVERYHLRPFLLGRKKKPGNREFGARHPRRKPRNWSLFCFLRRWGSAVFVFLGSEISRFWPQKRRRPDIIIPHFVSFFQCNSIGQFFLREDFGFSLSGGKLSTSRNLATYRRPAKILAFLGRPPKSRRPEKKNPF